MSTHSKKTFGRRRFLVGAGGVTLGLPILEGFLPRKVHAATPPFLGIICSANGVVQAKSGEAEAWWPTTLGPLTQAKMLADKPTRATGELSDYAAKLLIVRGIGHSLPSTGCNHASGCAQILTGTAAIVGTSNQAQSSSASVDTIVAGAINPPGVDPCSCTRGCIRLADPGSTSPRTSRISRASSSARASTRPSRRIRG
jgi:hypothetical protein